MPKFAQVKALCIVQQRFQDLWFITEEFYTTSFNAHLNAYEISSKEHVTPVKQHLPPYIPPLHIIQKDEAGMGKSYVSQNTRWHSNKRDLNCDEMKSLFMLIKISSIRFSYNL